MSSFSTRGSTHSKSSYSIRLKRLATCGLFSLIMIGITLIWFGSSAPLSAQTHDPQAQDLIEQAWDKVEEVESYAFRTRLVQFVYPAPSIANAGRPPQESTLGIAGTYETNRYRMETTLWSDGTFDPNSGIDMLIENGRSYVRQPNETEWEEINDFSSSFAPGGDPISFLSGMSNVQATGTDARTVGEVSLNFTTYTFDLDGVAMADYVSRITTQMLQEQGELPQGMTSSAGEGFREITGQGRVCIGEDGYLARIELDIALPAEESGEWVEAQLTSDFFDYTLAETAVLPSFFNDPTAWMNGTVTAVVQPETGATLGWFILGFAFLALFALLIWHKAHSKTFHTTLIALIISSMILSPLIHAEDVHAYYEEQLVRSEAQAEQEQKIEQYEAINAEAYGDDWNPHQKPVISDQYSVVSGQNAQSLNTDYRTLNTDLNSVAAAAIGDSDTDTDSDGVNDADEALWDSCPYPNPSTEYNNEEDCANVTDPADSDGDTLPDYAEIYELGTLPDEADSDGDTIDDYLEVQGFSYNSTQWYLNPLESDTNNDGNSDALECPLWSSENDYFDASAICPDTDNDGNPDLFDADDDGDGVWDIDDSAPTIAGDIYDDATPMELSIDGLEINKPVLVDLQFRPTDPDLLTYSGLVLDWPDGDYEGQITRGMTTTFATTSNTDAQSDDDTAVYGDIKITPVMEITIPYSEGHYGNLPVNDTYFGIDRTIGITVDQWIDDTELDTYAISVTDVDETSGDLTAYVPLSTVYSEAGDSPVAFSATMFYSPTQGTANIAEWGEAHQYRLAWMVQMITDDCVDDVDEDGDGDTDNEEYDECTREDELSVIHIYQDEPWQLTALTISEEHGMDVAQLYENPVADPDLNVEDQLWLYAWNMANTFIDGVDCDSTTTNADGTVDCVGDGTRDVTLADLPTKLDEWGTDADDSINYNYVALDGIDSYDHSGYLSYVASTETTAVLDTVFSPYTSSQLYSSILIAYETTNRSIDIADATNDGSGGLLFDLTDELTSLTAGMTWKTFSYDDDTTSWEEADTEAYLEFLTEYLETYDSFFTPTDESDEAAEEVEGKLLWFQSYYLTLTAGLVAMVEYDNTTINLPSFESSDDSIDFLNDIEALYDTATTSAAKRLGTFLFYYISDIVLKTDLSTSTWAYMRLIYSADDLSSYVSNYSGKQVYFREYKSFKLFGNKKFTQLTVQDGSLRMVKTSLKVFIVGAAFVAVGTIFNSLGLSDVGNVIIAIGMVIVAIASIALVALETIALIGKYKLIATLRAEYSSGAAMAKIRSVDAAYKRTYRVHAAYGLVVGIGVALIAFGFALNSLGNSPRGYEVAAAAAYLIASIIVELIFFVIGLFIPFGTLIVLFLEIVDIILLVLSFFWDDAPDTIQGALTDAIADALYDFDLYANNMEDEDRLLMDFDYDLADSELGYVESNALVVSTTVTNTLWTKNFSRDDLKRNAFEYAVSEDETALDGITLGVNYNSAEWENINYDDYSLIYPDAKFYGDKGVWFTRTVTAALPFAENGTGINNDTENSYFLEKYRLVGEGCWKVLFDGAQVSCKEYAFKDTSSTELSAFTFDVLPDSLADFVSLNWNRTMLDMPDQYDQDGDGVINQAYNGADPNDTDADSDDDGIHDYFEIVDGYDPEAADGDGDGLNDWEELYLYDSDPTLADTDNDGLSDYAEAKTGWTIAYTDGSGSTQITRVWSDPTIDDLDDDGLGDLQEMIYGFNPNVANDSSDVDNLIEIEDILLEEEEGPLFLLKFEEDEDETVVTDYSGYNNDFSCDSSANTCPEMGVDGAYGNAFSFNGANDQLTLNDIDGDLSEFTMAAWVYPTGGGNSSFRVIMGDQATSQKHAPTLYLYNETLIRARFSDGSATYPVTTGSVISPDSWNHVASTFDGTSFIVYINGTAVLTDTSAAGKTPYPFTEYHLGYHGNNNHFNGRIDEALLYARALSATEIDDVMNGRYDTNDLIVRPGANLSYQATITNTSASRDANGFLYADSHVDYPEVPDPVMALGFDIEQRLAYFPSAIELKTNDPTVESGGILYCIDDGTCPTAGATGAINTSLDFDGVDDTVYIPKLSSDITELHDDENQIFFWIYVDAYPSSGNAMILDTDDSSDGAMDIYIDSSGYLHFDSVGYGDGTSLTTIPLQTWTHIGYRDGKELTINGGTDGAGDIIATNTNSSARHPIWGPGRLGNSLDGSEPFNGRIDEIAIYHGSVADSLLYNYIYTGDYFRSASGLRADAVFDLDQLITDDTNSNVGYVNLVNELREADCVSTAIGCPTVTNSGQYGEALTFDGTNDALDLGTMAFAKSDYTIGMWFNTNPLMGSQTLLSAYDDNGLALQLHLSSSSEPHFLHRFPGGDSGGTELSTTTHLYDNAWHYFTAVKEEDTLYLYLDGELVDSATEVTSVASDDITVVLGYHATDNDEYFDGEIDELVILDEAVDVDGVNYLMNSQYPAIEIPNVFESFSVDAQTTAVPSGTATVADHVESGSVHAFEEEVEVAFDLTETINVTTYNHDAADDTGDGNSWSGYFRFEEVPGSTTFENQVLYNTFGTANAVDEYISINATCIDNSCPIAGVRGVEGRALYFDGVDDYLHVNTVGNIVLTSGGTYDDLTTSQQPTVQSISVWVNGSEGTIFNRGQDANGYHFQVDFGRVSYIDGYDNYTTFEFDMPVNEWTHLVAAITDSGVIRVFVNGGLVGALNTGDASADVTRGDWHIGANHGTQNHFKGYMDELRLYELQIGDTWAQTLYENTLPRIRFEFDEASDETNFVDSISGYVAEPVTIECTDLNLESLTAQNLDSDLTNIALYVGDDMVYYGSVDEFGAVVTGTTAVSQTLNISTPICSTAQTITASGIYSDGTEVAFSGSVSAAIAEVASTDVVFTESSQQMTLSYASSSPYNATSPIAGKDGRIGNTLYFPGNDQGYLEVLESEGLGDFATEDFTIMGWIKTDESTNPIWAKDDGDGVNEAGEKYLTLTNGNLVMSSIGASQNVFIYSTEAIDDNVWHHFAVTWDYDGTGGSYAIYIDGVDVTAAWSTYTATNPDNSSDSWKIGRRSTGGNGHYYFDGELDELTYYLGRSLESTLVYETYLREARWYRDTAQFSVLVDDDAPTLTLQTKYRFSPGGYMQLVATPHDATSAIELVQFGIKGPSDSDYTWDTAELCSDSSVVYCPRFMSSGSGQYDVIFRIVDSVGNETTSEVYDFYVDNIGPAINGNGAVAGKISGYALIDQSVASLAADTELAAAVTQIGATTWEVALSGTISDPDLDTGISGSGVNTNTLYITLQNSALDVVGSPNQQATVNNDGSWTIAYEITGIAPAGRYTVTASAEDEVENSSETSLGTFAIDAQAPAVKMAHRLWPDQLISATHTISGVVTDQPDWAGPVLALHFEEGDGANAYYNYGGEQQLLTCSGNCPTNTAAGAFGRALNFDDGYKSWTLDNTVISDAVNFDSGDDFTIAFWIQPDVQSNLVHETNSIIEKWGDGSSYPYSIGIYNSTSSDEGKIVVSRSDGTHTAVLTSTAVSGIDFHHIALVKDGDLLTLYMDGAAQMSVTDTATGDTTNSDSLAIAHRPDDADTTYRGILDELYIYDRSLSGADIYAMAQDEVDGNNQVEVAFEVIDFATYPDLLSIDGRQTDVTWQAATVALPTDLGSSWSYTMPDMENWYYIHVRGQDGSGNEADAETVWHGLIDHVPPTITASGVQSGSGASAETVYTFTVNDILLDLDTAVYPCATPEITTQTYNNSDAPFDGFTYEISGTCTVDELQTSGTFSICDVAGHCVSEIVTPIPSNDVQYELAAETTSVAELDLGATTTLTYTITRSGDLDGSSSVDFDFLASLAELLTDFDNVQVSGTGINEANGTITFTTGAEMATITLDLLGDDIDETDEEIVLTLSSPTVADGMGVGNLVNSPATTTIVDDDTRDVLLVGADSGLAVTEGGITATYTLALASEPTAPVTITIGMDNSELDLGLGAGGAISLTYTTLDWMTPQTVTVTAVDDTFIEPIETTVLSHTVAGGDYGALTPANINVTITDDDIDDNMPRLSITDSSAPETDLSGSMLFTVTLNAPLDFTITVDYVTQDDTAVAGEQYTATTGTLTFAPGGTVQTIVVPIIGNTDSDPNSTFQVVLSNSNYAFIEDNMATGTIIDDDGNTIFLPMIVKN